MTHHALESLKSLRLSGTPTQEQYEDVMRILGNDRQPRLAEQLLRELDLEGVIASGVAYSRLIKAYHLVGDKRQADVIAAEMKSRSIAADDSTFSARLSGKLSEKDLQEALTALHAAPSRPLYTTVIGAYAMRGDFAAVDQQLKAMSERGFQPDPTLFHTIISSACHGNNIDKTELYFQQMAQRGLSRTAFAFRVLINGCVANDRAARAIELFEQAEREGIAMDNGLIMAAISAYGALHKLSEANSLLQTSRRKNIGVNADTYNALLKTYASHQLPMEMARVVSQMQAENVALNSRCYLTLITAASDTATALRLFEQCIRDSVILDDNVYRALGARLPLADRVALTSHAMRQGIVPAPSPVAPRNIDLHQTSIAMAPAIVILHFDMLAQMHDDKALATHFSAKGSELAIITGRGLHAKSGQSALQPAMLRLCYQHLRPLSGPFDCTRAHNTGALFLKWPELVEVLYRWPTVRKNILADQTLSDAHRAPIEVQPSESKPIPISVAPKRKAESVSGATLIVPRKRTAV
eukprot:TRINITY_DN1744_c0_g1_i1.p1 TRINITY_DN1744_c0_g1~~TRINITY_DN1744_c0_g1_i1.p1  ORF type:complete len:526 (+),score=103.21 TRINITY_DN1744_c0_g1_i1:1614-3191(+)